MAKKRSKKRRKKSLLLKLLLLLFSILKAVWKALVFLLSSLVGLALALFRTARATAKEAKRPYSRAQFSALEALETVEGSLKSFESSLYTEPSLIGLIVGARGSGKSALGMRLLENVKAKGRKVAAMGFKESSLPKWIKPIKSIEEIENGSFVLIDEGGIEFSSRAAMSSANKLLTELMLIARHKDVSILFITQNSANIEVNTLRQVDYLLLKRPSLLQLDFERKKIRDIYAKAKEGFERHEGKGVFYVYAHNFIGFARASLPSFWSERLSKSYG